METWFSKSKNILIWFLAQSPLANGTNQNHSSYSSTETILISDNDNITDNKKKEQDISANTNQNSLNYKKSLKINVMRDLKSAQKLKNTISNTKYSQFVAPNSNDFVSKSFTSTSVNSRNYHRDNKKDFLNNSHGNYSSYESQHDQLEKMNENIEQNLNIEGEFDYLRNEKRNQIVNSSTLPRNNIKSRNIISNAELSSVCKNNYLNESGSDFLINKNNDTPMESQISFYNDKSLKYVDINGK